MRDKSHSPVQHDECALNPAPFHPHFSGGKTEVGGEGCQLKITKPRAPGVLASCLPALSGAQLLCPANKAHHSLQGCNCPLHHHKRGFRGGVWVSSGLGLLRDRTPRVPTLFEIHFTAREAQAPESKDSSKVASSIAAGREPRRPSAQPGLLRGGGSTCGARRCRRRRGCRGGGVSGGRGAGHRGCQRLRRAQALAPRTPSAATEPSGRPLGPRRSPPRSPLSCPGPGRGPPKQPGHHARGRRWRRRRGGARAHPGQRAAAGGGTGSVWWGPEPGLEREEGDKGRGDPRGGG